MKLQIKNIFIILIIGVVALTSACNNSSIEEQDLNLVEGTVLIDTGDRVLIDKNLNNVDSDFKNDSIEDLIQDNKYDLIWLTKNDQIPFEVGQIVEVEIDGAIAESYPAQAKARKISIVSREEISDNQQGDIEVVYLIGDFNEELDTLQKQNFQGEKNYNIIIENKEEFDDITEKYGLKLNDGKEYEKEREFFNNYIIIAIFPEQLSKEIDYIVKDINQENGLNIHIEEIDSQQASESLDLVNKPIFIEVKKEIWEKRQEVIVNVFNKNDLSVEDLQLGKLKLGISKEEIQGLMDADIKKMSQPAPKYPNEESLFYEDGTQIIIRDMEVYKISINNEKYETPRGLKVGDSVDKLIGLYGEPSQISKGIYSYDLAQYYYLLHVKIEDDKVVAIEINLNC